jgi:hypothetical protein
VNKLVALLLTAFVSINMIAQSTAELPHEEFRPYFKLAPYKRGFDKDSLNELMQYLIEKPRKRWTKNDSISYVMSLCNADEYDLAHSVFERLKLTKLGTQEEYHIVQHMLHFKTRFFAVEDWLDFETRDYPQFAEANKIRKRINHVSRLYARKEWRTNDSLVFPELNDVRWKKMKRGSPTYLNELIPLVWLYDEALRTEVQFESKRNTALSEAFVEFGDFLHAYVNLSDAFIAYSIARYYNKTNNHAAIKLKSLKAEMNRKNILFPSMRKMFPKQDKGVFNYKNILEKRQKQRDSLSKDVAPPLTVDFEEPRFSWFSDKLEYIIILVGLVVLLLLVVLFVKTK